MYGVAFRKDKKKMWSMIIVLIVCFGIIVCMIIPPSFGIIKPFQDENGHALQGSISEKIIVDINDASLGMFIMGKDTSKPLLLFLGGGPGIPEYFLETQYPSGLENEFIVCYLEYRGTALSYHPNMLLETMTTAHYMQDVVEVTNYLRKRFGQDKIYLMGHSFGTYIGLLTASRHPELYQAYIGMSQITNQEKSERLAYSYMLEQYQHTTDTKMISRFDSYPIFSDDSAYTNYFNSSLRDTAMHELGVGTMHNMHSVIKGIFLPSLRCREYTPFELLHIWRGKAFVKSSAVVADVTRFNAFLEVPAVDIPIYFFAGLYDYTCCYSLQKAYFDQVQAPIKAFYTFHHSAHSPLFEEPDKAGLILREDVLTGSIGHADIQSSNTTL